MPVKTKTPEAGRRARALPRARATAPAAAPSPSADLREEQAPLPASALTPNPKNPRVDWTTAEAEAFKESLMRFGDLSGIVYNTRTGQLVGGHKRLDVFRKGTDVSIVAEPLDAPDPQQTVAVGHVLVDAHRFAYREVAWEPDTEAAANLAANRWSAGWDWPVVASILQGLTEDDVRRLTGFEPHELDNLLAADLTEQVSKHPTVLSFTAEQYATIVRAKALLTAHDTAHADTDITDARVIELCCADWLSGAL